MADEDAVSGVHDVAVDLPTHGEAVNGLVLKWRRRGDLLEGLVTRETADGKVLTEWLPALVLLPLDWSAGEDGAADRTTAPTG